MSQRISHITATTFTVDDMHRRIGLWRSVLEATVFQQGSDESGLRAEAIAAIADEADREVVMGWDEAVWSGVSAESLAHEAEALEHALAALPVTILYVPVALTADACAELGAWSRAELGLTLLDIKIDPAVVGGAAVVAPDATYHEFSLRTKLAAAPGTITSLLSSYVSS